MGGSLLTTFLFLLAGGMLAALATARADEVSWKFLRLVGVVILAIAATVLTGAISRESEGATGPYLAEVALAGAMSLSAAMILAFAPMAAKHHKTFRCVCGLGGLAGLAAGSGHALAGLDPGMTAMSSVVLLLLGQILAGWMLGSITVAWLLGHAYLIRTKMSMAPLEHFSRLLWWAVGARLVFAVGSVGLAWAIGIGSADIAAELRDQWLVVSLRFGLGLAGVAVFAYMVSDCVRLRSTQSATGILYFGSIFAYIGELASQYLVAEFGWPV